jgi:hypothetical protein
VTRPEQRITIVRDHYEAYPEDPDGAKTDVAKSHPLHGAVGAFGGHADLGLVDLLVRMGSRRQDVAVVESRGSEGTVRSITALVTGPPATHRFVSALRDAHEVQQGENMHVEEAGFHSVRHLGVPDLNDRCLPVPAMMAYEAFLGVLKVDKDDALHAVWAWTLDLWGIESIQTAVDALEGCR